MTEAEPQPGAVTAKRRIGQLSSRDLSAPFWTEQAGQFRSKYYHLLATDFWSTEGKFQVSI